MDSEGLPHAVLVTTANITDRKGALTAISLHDKTLTHVECVVGDGGYTGASFAQGVSDLIQARVEIVKRTELHKFKVLPRRWVVERSFAWLERNRRLWKNCEHLKASSTGMISLAYIALLLRRS